MSRSYLSLDSRVKRSYRDGMTYTVGKTRSFLYQLARGLGDYQAVRHGRIGKRVARRIAGRMTGRMLGRMFR